MKYYKSKRGRPSNYDKLVAQRKREILRKKVLSMAFGPNYDKYSTKRKKSTKYPKKSGNLSKVIRRGDESHKKLR